MLFDAVPGKRLIIAKGFLFLALGLGAAGLILLADPRWRTLLLLTACVWAFCRFYFFAFYVIERWVDPGYRFTGLLDFLRWCLRRRRDG